jgi:hypothetical protein
MLRAHYMSSKKLELHCLNCKQSEYKTPLLHLCYNGNEQWICSQCLPILIHAPHKLMGMIENAEQIKPSEHHKH